MSNFQILEGKSGRISYRSLGVEVNPKRRVLFFHGFPGSSVQAEMFSRVLHSESMHVICVDRPGYNQTEKKVADQMQQAILDAKEVLSFFGWESFEVFTVSGGTPFGIAMVRAFPNIVNGLTIISGLCPIGEKAFGEIFPAGSKRALRFIPLLPGFVLKKFIERATRKSQASREGLLQKLLPAAPADQKCIQDLSVRASLNTGLREAFALNGLGPKADAKLFLSNWSLDLKNYSGPIRIHHGDQDKIIPVAVAKLMNKKISNSTLQIHEGEGHYSLAILHVAKLI